MDNTSDCTQEQGGEPVIEPVSTPEKPKIPSGRGMMKGNQYGQGFKKGVSGNPSGRPMAIDEIIKQKTKNGRKLVEFNLAVMEGKLIVKHEQDGRTIKRSPSIADRLRAAEWLADRGFGKVVQDVSGSVSLLNVGLTFPEFRRVQSDVIEVTPIGEALIINELENGEIESEEIEHPDTSPTA